MESPIYTLSSLNTGSCGDFIADLIFKIDLEKTLFLIQILKEFKGLTILNL
jgi:hypothetical protein